MLSPAIGVNDGAGKLARGWVAGSSENGVFDPLTGYREPSDKLSTTRT
jgi:hypothetical protein